MLLLYAFVLDFRFRPESSKADGEVTLGFIE